MKGEKLYELLDALDDTLVLESAEVKRTTWRRRLALVAAVVAVIAAVWFFTTEPVRHPREDVGGQIGVIQDGVYYVYAGSGVPAPKEARAPQGLVRYVPGQGKEVLVPYRDHRLDISGPVWGLNAQGLYYIDRAENQLWRLDLTTGEETLLYEAPTLSPGRWDRQDRPLWETLLEDIHDTAYDAALFLDQVTEDTVTLTYRYTDGATTDTLVLDSRTGDLRSKTRNQAGQWTQYVGDRAIETVVMPHTEGFTYPGWEDDAETNAYRWTDIRENNVSLLPPGTMEGQSDTAQDFRGGLLVGYCPRETLDENGNYLQYATGYLLLTADGATYDLPGPAQGEERTYHCAAGDWVYYSCRSWTATDTGGRRMTQQLRAQHLDTGEDVLIEDNLWGNQVVTDGTWCYLSDEITTTCCRLEWDGQGRPCGLTVVEEGL